MKLYNIVVNNCFSGEPYSFNAVGENISFDDAHKLAKDYLVGEGYDDIDDEEIDVVECYTIDDVDGYKIKLVKE